MTTIAVRVHILGKVQGVFFRASTLEQAQALHVNGSVENLYDDGNRVLLIAQGERENVEALLRWAHAGPPQAEVYELHIQAIDLDEKRIAFRIVQD